MVGGIYSSIKSLSIDNNNINNSKQLLQDLGRPRTFQFMQSGAICYTMDIQVIYAPAATAMDSSI